MSMGDFLLVTGMSFFLLVVSGRCSLFNSSNKANQVGTACWQ